MKKTEASSSSFLSIFYLLALKRSCFFFLLFLALNYLFTSLFIIFFSIRWLFHTHISFLFVFFP